MHTQRDDGHFLHYDLHNVVPTVEKGQGIYLYDGNGKKYIDGSSGPVVVNIGHGVKEIGEGISPTPCSRIPKLQRRIVTAVRKVGNTHSVESPALTGCGKRFN